MISRKFKIAVKLAEIPAWKIALRAGIHPSTLSKIMVGEIFVKPGDIRVRRVAEIIGLSEEDCFQKENERQEI